MHTYSLYQMYRYLTGSDSLQEIMSLADTLIKGSDQSSSFTVRNEDDQPIAVFTNRKIIGIFTFTKTRPGKSTYVEDGEFDVTEDILKSRLEDIQSIMNQPSDFSKALVKQRFDWVGQCDVSLKEPICEYFGVTGLHELTEEILVHARSRANPMPQKEVPLGLSFIVNVSLPEAEGHESDEGLISSFIENMDFSFSSNTIGVKVISSEIAF